MIHFNFWRHNQGKQAPTALMINIAFNAMFSSLDKFQAVATDKGKLRNLLRKDQAYIVSQQVQADISSQRACKYLAASIVIFIIGGMDLFMESNMLPESLFVGLYMLCLLWSRAERAESQNCLTGAYFALERCKMIHRSIDSDDVEEADGFLNAYIKFKEAQLR